MFMKTARSRLLAAALALGGLGLAAPAMAAPLGPDAGLHHGHDGLVAVQYGHHGWGHRHGPRWHGHHRHHGHHYGWRHHGPRWGHHHHHRGHWGHHRHHHGHW